MNKITRAIVLVAFVLTAATAVLGQQQATATFNVTATLEYQCTVSATTLDFGNAFVGDTSVDGEATVTVNCSAGAPYSILLDAGAAGDRTLRGASTAGLLSYELYQDSPRTALWGDSGSTHTADGKSGTGTGGDAVHTVYGRIASLSGATAEDYSDTVGVIIKF